jgi:hypothetical protein
MSIGNLKTEGSKGTNFPWQYKMLKGIGELVRVSGGGGSTAIKRTVNSKRPAAGDLDDAGTIEDAYSASFANVGAVDIRVDNTIVKVGETVNFDGGGPLLSDISYDASIATAEVLIIYIT